MKPVPAFLTAWVLAGVGAVIGSILGNAGGKPGLFAGAVVGGVVGIGTAVAAVTKLRWLACEDRRSSSWCWVCTFCGGERELGVKT